MSFRKFGQGEILPSDDLQDHEDSVRAAVERQKREDQSQAEQDERQGDDQQ